LVVISTVLSVGAILALVFSIHAVSTVSAILALDIPHSPVSSVWWNWGFIPLKIVSAPLANVEPRQMKQRKVCGK
jgi:hypothetical protein